MKQTLTIKNFKVDLNSYIRAERGNKWQAASIKKDFTNLVKMESISQKLKPMQSPVSIFFTWWVVDKKRDKDNIMFGQKFILDGLVAAGVIKNDSYKDIFNLNHTFVVSSYYKEPAVTIDIWESEEAL